MKKLFIYDKGYTETHLFPNGALATPEVVLQNYPAVAHFPQMVELVGNTIMAVQDFSVMREHYNIDPELSEAEALATIETIINTPAPDPGPSPEEIAAAATVMQALAALPDNPQPTA